VRTGSLPPAADAERITEVLRQCRAIGSASVSSVAELSSLKKLRSHTFRLRLEYEGQSADRSQAGAIAFDTEHQMDSTLDDRFAEGQIASLEEQLSNLAREAGVSPSAPPTSMKTSRAPLTTIHRLADWRYVAFVGSLLAASIGVAAWWWSSSVERR
jgi:hypothetical protein